MVTRRTLAWRSTALFFHVSAAPGRSSGMTSFQNDRNRTGVGNPISFSPDPYVLGEAFEGMEHALLIFDARKILISANARARKILNLQGGYRTSRKCVAGQGCCRYSPFPRSAGNGVRARSRGPICLALGPRYPGWVSQCAPWRQLCH